MYLEPCDKLGRLIAVGDWVRLVAIPPGIAGLPRETRTVFRKALGKTFKIEAFGPCGHAELDLSKKVARNNTVWVEPEHLVLSRRGRKQ